MYGEDKEGRMIRFSFGSGRISIVQASKTAWQDQQFSSISNPITASTKKPKNKFFFFCTWGPHLFRFVRVAYGFLVKEEG